MKEVGKMLQSRFLSMMAVVGGLFFLTAFGAGTVAAQTSTLALVPPDAKPGECYAKVLIPPKYKTVTERVLMKAATEKVEIIPAKYEMVEEKVMVEPASERWEVVPAEYKWVEEKVVLKEASSRMETVPAKYAMKEEQVLVKPAETKWKRGRGPIEKLDGSTGEILCLVEEPAVYKPVKKQVVVEPAKTVKVDIPAEHGTVKKKVLVTPPTVKKIEVPAVYKTMTIRKMVAPPQEKRTAIPEEYQMVTRNEKVSEARTEWARILCETNTTPDFVKRVQESLAKAGFNPGPVDGSLGGQTQVAIQAFQKKNGLSVGALTYETVEKLGLKLN
jgi:hypothetical protein